MGTAVDGVFAQAAPAAAAEADLYEVAALLSGGVKGTLFICNRDAGSSAITIAIARNEGATAVENYLAYDSPVDTGKTVIMAGFVMPRGARLRVKSDTGNVSFTFCGEVISP